MSSDNQAEHRLTCPVTRIESLGADVYGVQLQLPNELNVNYQAGQYLLIEREDGEVSAFSIASAPQSGQLLELHILARENSALALLEQLRREQQAQIRLPFGEVTLSELDERPLLLIAAGTGMAQMHSLLEYCRHQQAAPPIHLYWGARAEEDFYTLPGWQQWQTLAHVHLHKIVSHDPSWHGRCGLLHEAVSQDLASLENFRVFVSGSPTMVYATLDAFVAAGMQPEQMQADAFSYAPRPAALSE